MGVPGRVAHHCVIDGRTARRARRWNRDGARSSRRCVMPPARRIHCWWWPMTKHRSSPVRRSRASSQSICSVVIVPVVAPGIAVSSRATTQPGQFDPLVAGVGVLVLVRVVVAAHHAATGRRTPCDSTPRTPPTRSAVPSADRSPLTITAAGSIGGHLRRRGVVHHLGVGLAHRVRHAGWGRSARSSIRPASISPKCTSLTVANRHRSAPRGRSSVRTGTSKKRVLGVRRPARRSDGTVVPSWNTDEIVGDGGDVHAFRARSAGQATHDVRADDLVLPRLFAVVPRRPEVPEVEHVGRHDVGEQRAPERLAEPDRQAVVGAHEPDVRDPHAPGLAAPSART